MESLSDIDFLAFMSRGLDEAKSPDRRQSSQSRDLPNDDARRGKVLNSLASALVSTPQKQVIAIGAIVQPDGGLKLVVAANNNISATTANYLRGILADLHDVRSVRPVAKGSPRINPFPRRNSDPTSFNSRLIALEHKIVRYTVRKLMQRFKKNDRHANFINTAQDVLGSQQHIADRTDDERRELDDLRSKVETINHGVDRKKGEPTLNAVLVVVEHLASLFKDPKANLTEKQFESIRPVLHAMRGWKEVLGREQEFCRKWNKYTRQRCAATGTLITGEKYDVHRWLSKATVVCDDFEEIASVATSNTLASSFLSGPLPQIQLLEEQTTTLAVSIDRQVLFDVLTAAGCPPEELEQDKANMFLDRLADVHQTTLNVDRKLVMIKRLPVHCECKVLAELHLQNAAALIGVSKLSCAFCDLYFSAYRDAVVGSQTCTTGSHDRSFTWACPHLPLGQSDVDTNIRGQVRERLYASIKKGWAEYGQVSRNSMSTDASGEYVRASDEEDVIDLAFSAIADANAP